MAKFKITPTTTVAELKEQYRNEVGGVLRVYDGRSEAPEDATLVSLGANEGELECRTSRTVGKFEEAFQKDLNLKVKVYTKGNGGKVLDGITLATSAKLPYGMTKAKMEEYLSYKRDEKEEESTESGEVPEEYKGLPIIEITTEEIDIDDCDTDDFPAYPTVGIVFHGYESNASQGCVLVCDTHEELCERANDFIENEISSDEDIPVRVIESSKITGYGQADDLEEIPDVIGCALNEYYDGGNDHSFEYEWPEWFAKKAIFVVDDDVFIADKNGGIDFIKLTDAQLDKIKENYSDKEHSADSDTSDSIDRVSDAIVRSVDDEDFVDGIAAVKINGKYGFIDRKGNIVIEPKFDWAGNFYDEPRMARVEINGKLGFINKNGEVVIEPKFDDAYDFDDNIATVKINGKWGYINQSGNFVIEPKFDSANDFVNDIANVEINDKWGWIDKNGDFVIEPKFDTTMNFVDDIAKVKINGKWGWIDKSGDFVIEPKYDYAGNFWSSDTAEVGLNGEEFKIDKQGNRVEK